MWATVAWFGGRPMEAARRFRDVALVTARLGDLRAAAMARRHEALTLALAGDPAARGGDGHRRTGARVPPEGR